MTVANPEKLCAACGRRFGWQKRWARNWPQIRYCSQRCRSRRIRPVDQRLEESIIDLLHSRHGSICPSEAARQIGGENWRRLMEATRSAARRMAASGRIEIQQGGKRVDPTTICGPIRLVLVRPSASADPGL